MAKWNIIRTCGHEETVNICGPTKDRQRRADYEATRQCYDCWRAALTAKREAANTAAAQANTEAGLVALVGSPKQIAWAETIRADILARADRAMAANVAAAIRQGIALEIVEQTKAAYAPVLARLAAQPQASWWIDRRNESAHTLAVALLAPDERATLTSLAQAQK